VSGKRGKRAKVKKGKKKNSMGFKTLCLLGEDKEEKTSHLGKKKKRSNGVG